MTPETTTAKPEKNWKEHFSFLLNSLPLLQWFGVIVITVLTYYSTSELNKAAQSAKLDQLLQNQQQLKSEMDSRTQNRNEEIKILQQNFLRRDVFEARADAIQQQLQLIRDELKEMRDSQRYERRTNATTFQPASDLQK